MRVVSNSTPIIFLAKIGKLDLLEHLFNDVLIPNQVYVEVVVKGKEKGYSDAFLVEKSIKKGVISKSDVEIEMLKEMPLGKGELSAIELAMKMEIRDILIDDAKARRIARVHGLFPKGTLWVLTRAFEEDLFSSEELKNSITELIKCGFRIKEEILVEIFKELMGA